MRKRTRSSKKVQNEKPTSSAAQQTGTTSELSTPSASDAAKDSKVAAQPCMVSRNICHLSHPEADENTAELRGKPLRSQEEKEKELFEQGSNLSGAALKDFLAKKLLNFSDSGDEDDDDGANLDNDL